MDFIKTKIFKRSDQSEGSRIGNPSISGVFHSPSSLSSSKKQKGSSNDLSTSQILPLVNKLGEELISDESLVDEIGITSTRSSVWIEVPPTSRNGYVSITENGSQIGSRISGRNTSRYGLHSENSFSENSFTPNTTTSSYLIPSSGTQTYGAQTSFPSSLLLSTSSSSSPSSSSSFLSTLSPQAQHNLNLSNHLSRTNLVLQPKPPRSSSSPTPPLASSSTTLVCTPSVSHLPEKRMSSESEIVSPSPSAHKMTRIRNLIGSNQSENQHKLLRLLMKPDLAVVQALCKSLLYEDEVNQMANCLISLFQHQGLALALIKNIIHSEIAKADDEGTLLRNTSAASILMSAYVRLNSFKYLSLLFKPLIHHLLSSRISIEIDPNRLEPGEDLEQNLANLFKVSKRFLEEICSSVEYCPRPLRFLSRILQQEVNEKFPGSAQTSMGGFFFLRFLCPAIVTPEAYNIIAPSALTKGSRRSLILISKVLQSLTNGVPFGDKEGYMVPLNQFIHDNTQMLDHFFVSLTGVDLEDQAVRYPTQTLKTSLVFVSECIHRHKPRIQEEIHNITYNLELDYDPYEIFSLFLARKKKKKKLKPF